MLSFIALLVLQASAERLLDMSHSVGEHSSIYVGYRPFERARFHKGWQNAEKNLWLESFDVSFNEHMSTHMDAPRHFNPDKRTVDEIPIEDLVGPAISIDMKERAASKDNAELAMEDVQKWIDENGPIPDKAIIFVNTGWGKRYHNRTAYFGTDTNEISELRFPGLGTEVAKFFASHYNETGRRVVGIGIDTPSLDPGNSTTYPAHVILQAENIFLLEHVANVDELPAVGAEVTVLPIKFTKGTGGPTRILARIPDSIPPNTPASIPESGQLKTSDAGTPASIQESGQSKTSDPAASASISESGQSRTSDPANPASIPESEQSKTPESGSPASIIESGQPRISDPVSSQTRDSRPAGVDVQNNGRPGSSSSS